MNAVNELIRVLKVGGRGLITVWAKEQKLNEKESYYIKKKGNKNQQSNAFRVDEADQIDEKTTTSKKAEAAEKPTIHDYGKEFEKQDLFVTWHHQGSKDKTKTLEKDNEVYLRFYHVFKSGELEQLFDTIDSVRIEKSFYEQGNWCVIFEKIK